MVQSLGGKDKVRAEPLTKASMFSQPTKCFMRVHESKCRMLAYTLFLQKVRLSISHGPESLT